ncbi:hypothetical protein PR003_g20023 [Phytophthora rubi]|uniref:Uncharacterized protein n=1 Tax=Phytophthora rubi TaxID=129364 RepID=A0A6A4DQR6_9STRA|nr:hypothetical protein PR003_g20023 [Phytophthora rubi]
MVEQFHETHMEVTLTADISPRAKLRRNMTHQTVLALLYAANADSARGRQMIDRVMDDVKLIHFDGIHTLKFVFNSRRVATLYQGLAFRLNGVCAVLEDSDSAPRQGTFHVAQLRRKYAIRVYGAERLGLVALLATLGKIPGIHVADAERPRNDGTEGIDTRHVLVRLQEEECPAALKGVTKMEVNGHHLTLHHHLIHLRMPCGRCGAPYHTTGFCKTKAEHLSKLHAKHQRKYAGAVPAHHVGTAVQYRHSDAESLAAFLDTLQRDLHASLEASVEAPHSHREARLISIVDVETQAPTAVTTTTSAPGVLGETEVERHSSSPVPQPTATAGDGYTVVRRRSKKGAAVSPREIESPAVGGARIGQATLPGPAQRLDVHSRRGQDTKAQTAGASQPPTQRRTNGKRPAGRSKPKQTNTTLSPTFAQFQRTRAQGQFEALADSDNGESEDEEAPYAYEAAIDSSMDATNHDNVAPRGPSTPTAPTRVEGPAIDLLIRPTRHEDPRLSDAEKVEKSGGITITNTCDGEDADMASDTSSVLSGYVGSSAPSCTPSPASLPGSEFPYSLDSDLNTPSHTPSPGQSLEPLSPRTAATEVAVQPRVQAGSGAPSLSQDGFTMVPTTPAPGMPQQLPVFLLPFNGALTTVPATGNARTPLSMHLRRQRWRPNLPSPTMSSEEPTWSNAAYTR